MAAAALRAADSVVTSSAASVPAAVTPCRRIGDKTAV
jgi:hypothetical protein